MKQLPLFSPRPYSGTPLNTPKGVCQRCGGLGQVAEIIDDEKAEALVPCYACHEFCRVCKKVVKKSGHDCVAAPKPVQAETTATCTSCGKMVRIDGAMRTQDMQYYHQGCPAPDRKAI